MIENFKSFKLNHALMEAGYVNHQSATLQSTSSHDSVYDAQATSISMTATMDSSGRSLILGNFSFTYVISKFALFHLNLFSQEAAASLLGSALI